MKSHIPSDRGKGPAPTRRILKFNGQEVNNQDKIIFITKKGDMRCQKERKPLPMDPLS